MSAEPNASAEAWRKDGRLLFAVSCAAVGIAYLTIGLVRHDVWLAVGGLLVMVAYGVATLILGRRNEAAALLSGNPVDERQTLVMTRAIAFTGNVLVLTLVVGFLITLALNSRYTLVFGGLCAVSGVSYIAATSWYARRL